MRLIFVLLIVVGGCLTGCAGKNASFSEKQQAFSAALDGLRQANFKGRVRFAEGGSLLGVNASTHWSLGPAQSNLEIEGEVDFTKPSRLPEVEATAPIAFYPGKIVAPMVTP